MHAVEKKSRPQSWFDDRHVSRLVSCTAMLSTVLCSHTTALGERSTYENVIFIKSSLWRHEAMHLYSRNPLGVLLAQVQTRGLHDVWQYLHKAAAARIRVIIVLQDRAEWQLLEQKTSANMLTTHWAPLLMHSLIQMLFFRHCQLCRPAS